MSSCRLVRRLGPAVVHTVHRNVSSAEIAALNVALIGGFAAVSYPNRVRGGLLVPKDTVRVDMSTIPDIGHGLFAAEFIAQGTLLGHYPGRLYDPEEWIALKGHIAVESLRFVWTLKSGKMLDPTNVEGKMDRWLPGWPFGFRRVDASLAMINEPPPSGDTNITIEENGEDVLLIAERDIYSDEELFMDYGSVYNREDYAKQLKELEDS